MEGSQDLNRDNDIENLKKKKNSEIKNKSDQNSHMDLEVGIKFYSCKNQ